MSFIGNLAKGFIRSAVNQVGRDGGKVISNKVYGNAHSTPIRGVSNISNAYDGDTSVGYEEQEFVNTNADWFKYILAVFACLFLPLFGGLFVLFYGFNKKKQTTIKRVVHETQSVRVADGRYKGGYRIEHRAVPRIVREVASEANRAIYKAKGDSYIKIALIVMGVQLMIVIVGSIK